MPTETIEPRFEWAMTFLAIAESGSFTKAADALGCSKAYVSKQVNSLEKALGAKLLHRTTRHVSPTETGIVYLQYCRQLRETLLDAERTVLSMKSEVRGRVRMSVPTTLGMEFMCDLVASLHAKHPEIELDLDLSAEPRDLVALGFDLALRLSRTLDPRLIAIPIGVCHEWVVASPDLIGRVGAPTQPAQLSDQPCLCNSHFQDEGRWVFVKGESSEEVRVRNWWRVNNFGLMRRAALSGLGFARLPTYLIEADVAEGRLVRVLADHTLPVTPLHLVYADQRPLPQKIRATIDHVAGWFLAEDSPLVRVRDRAVSASLASVV
jgi:DNA-binding transcriptional LysR family regulator